MSFWRFCAAVFLANSLCASAALSADESAPDIDPQLRAALAEAIAQPHDFEDRYDAEVWLLPRSESLGRFISDPSQRISLLRLIRRESLQAGLDPDLVRALIEVDSAFNRFAVSRSGAQGLMQVMSFWKNELGRLDDNLTDLETNLRYGCAILAYYLDMESGQIDTALARYNGSYGQLWYSQRVLTALKNWR